LLLTILPTWSPRDVEASLALRRPFNLQEEAMQGLTDLLTTTSKTLAVSVGLLPLPLRTEVSIAYLLLTVADILEQAPLWSARQRVMALAKLDVLIGTGDTAAAAWDCAEWAEAMPYPDDADYALLAELPRLLEAAGTLESTARATIVRHVRRTVSGMVELRTRSGVPGEIELRSFEELRHYCYVVAGIVCEMLTELFVEQGHVPRSHAVTLWKQSSAFGEGLQLVNMLEDAEDPQLGPGGGKSRSLLPPGVDRARLFALAHDDLDIAGSYVTTMMESGAGWGLAGFTMLPVRFARETLQGLASIFPAARLSRREVNESRRAHMTASGITVTMGR
jgi:farnesyl-diphosphate farnesyltransferase